VVTGVTTVLRPLCSAVDCSIQFSLEEALEYFRSLGDEVFLFLPGPPADIYAREWKEVRVWPSMIGDYLFCPRLLWAQARLGLKLMTERGVAAAARGVELHRRYAEWLRERGVRMAPVRIDAGWLAAEIDAVMELDGHLAPVEVKSTPRRRAAHELQLQAYMWLLNAPRGYLVYPREVVEVRPSPAARSALGGMERTITSGVPPRPGRDCSECAYREACAMAETLK
jgi:CRISPR-associated protein Cas4